MDTVTRTSAVPGMRLETVKLIDALKNGSPGDTFTDEELLDVCGKSTKPQENGRPGPGYSYLCSAIRHCRNNYSVVWERLTGAGAIKCLAWHEVGESAEADRRRIHRRAKVACKKLSTVPLKDVPEESRPGFLAKAAHLGTMAAFSGKDTQKKLEARKVSEPLDMKKLLESLA